MQGCPRGHPHSDPVSRAKEETLRTGADREHRRSRPDRRCFTSAGLVLAAVFSVLTVLPVVFTVQLGLLVAVGVLLDAFIVRALLVQSLTLDIGPRVWWPGRLSRLDHHLVQILPPDAGRGNPQARPPGTGAEIGDPAGVLTR